MPAKAASKAAPWFILVFAFLMAVGSSVALVVSISKEQQSQRQFINLAKQGKEAHDGVCALRDDLTRRVHDSLVYLAHHPDGAPALGLSRKDILTSISNQQRTVNILKQVHC